MIGAGGEAWILYSLWRFGGIDPARRWRSLSPGAPDPPEPWPSRVDAFMVACAIHAGQRERELINLAEGLLSGGRGG